MNGASPARHDDYDFRLSQTRNRCAPADHPWPDRDGTTCRAQNCPAVSGFGELLLLLHQFSVNLNLDVVADHRFAGLKHVVVNETEILAIDSGCCRNSAA